HTHTHAAPRSLTLGERLDRFRRNIIGEDEPEPEPPARAPRKANSPRTASSTTAARSAQGAMAANPATAAPQQRLTRQSAVKAQSSRAGSGQTIRSQAGASPSTARTGSGRAVLSPSPSSRRATAQEEETDEELPPAETIGRRPRGAVAEELEAPMEVDEETDFWDSTSGPEEATQPLPAKAAATGPRAEKPAAKTSAAEKGVLFARKSPVLSVETRGPRRITVGRPAEYKVVLKNEGELAANEIVVQINLPSSVELQDSRTSAGSVASTENGGGILQWTINSLAGGSREELALDLVSRENHPFDLAVRWTSAAMGSNATVEVQEAKLELKISGAREVLCGAKEIYRLSVSNPGNGDAENVVVRLLPLVPGEGEPSSHRLETIAAGDTKMVEIELVARQGGQLLIQAEVTAEGDLRAAATEEVAVRQAALDVAIVGPGRQYAGAVASYEIQLQNPGDAEARRVKLAAALPPQAEFVSCTRGGKLDAKRNRVVWTLDDLAPGAEESVGLKCLVQTAGENRIEAIAIADGDLKQTQVAVTQVVAVADLVLDVSDPSGPVAVGSDAVYELRVRNRGTKSAEAVEIVAFYSKGIEPLRAEGGAHEISPGTVAFDPIPALGAGEETVFKIHARADAGGTHRFRVELQCKSLGTKLTQEETTLFYSDEPASMQASKAPPPAAIPAKPQRTAKAPRTSELR
ncbi:MAG TPA: hypothetical protein VGN42_20425, partial [Pirellulales bacterium]|nr:hypothetical protein [Pirellulales bacterium]